MTITPKYRHIATMLLVTLSTATLFAKRSELPADVSKDLSSYNLTWDTPSTSGSQESMPIGNGDITSNVWVDANGDLMLYIGKSDCWSEATRLLKVGRVRVALDPNPFAGVTKFAQTLDLVDGCINITAANRETSARIRVWVDANEPVIHVDTEASRPVNVTCTTEIMRPVDTVFEGGGAHPLASSFRGLMDSPTPPGESADVVVAYPDRLEWYHRNVSSFYPVIFEKQNVAELIDRYPDPYINRTFGAAVTGTGMTAVSDTVLSTTRPVKSNHIAIAALTMQCDDVAEWQSALDAIVARNAATSLKTAFDNHCRWWDSFWNRSWIFLSGNENARTITRAYILQRYMMACQSRGSYPVKFNGGTLTFDYQGKNGDYRNWGPGYWYQNCRLYYWPLTASGDFDLKKPWFDMYMNMLPLQRDITRKYYGHDGAFFPETLNFFGMYIQDDWGWNNTGTASQTRWIRYHYEGAIEMLAEMLDYYNHTRDSAFATDYIIPFATQVIRFFDQHWPTINNQYRFIPANSLEQFWDCLNPIDYIAGLTHVIKALQVLPGGMVDPSLLEEWNGCLAKLPPLPKSPDGSRLLPAEEFGVDRNFENPQCYAIFPFRLYGKGRPDYDVALATFNNRTFKMSNCWSQCAIQAAALGLSDQMGQMLLRNASATDPAIRFPAFWKPGSDYIPDLDNGGVLAQALQLMLLDNIDGRIAILQAMPDDWSVDFKLHANDNTTVRVIADGRSTRSVNVTPASRANDVFIP